MQGKRRTPLTAVPRPAAAAPLYLLATVIVLLDQATKIVAVERLSDRGPVDLVPGVLDLMLTRNSGAAFSAGEGLTLFLSLAALVVCLAVLRVAHRLSSSGWALCLGGVLGGAAGNLIDRLLRSPGWGRGRVVDWIHLHHWPVFNVADSAIVVAGITFVLLSGRGSGATLRRRSLDNGPS